MNNISNKLDEIYIASINNFTNVNQSSLKVDDIFLKHKAIGILNSLILSKKIFKKNTQVSLFLETYFNIHLSKYMLGSRTLICGKISRHINDIDEYDELITLLNSLYKVLYKLSNEENLFDKDINDVIRGINL